MVPLLGKSAVKERAWSENSRDEVSSQNIIEAKILIMYSDEVV